MNENPFKKIVPEDSLPELHKKKVLDTLDTAKFLMEIADLFTLKQAQTDGVLVQTMLENWGTKKD
ncbi:hypothetical protein C7N43_10775 [Sphingobacteriales bacterium UPWRP_1]|nr:hypothetical protein BVG80_14115 [Sphingobacteriales bacterium TSM_CSM]PSJ77011.1 hypothetical protein C7N43_10775 [Sphingobacteriales bacterium UPWRP_1]